MSVWSNAFNQEAMPGAMNTPGFSGLPFHIQQPLLMSGYRGNPSGIETAVETSPGVMGRPGSRPLTQAPARTASPQPSPQQQWMADTNQPQWSNPFGPVEPLPRQGGQMGGGNGGGIRMESLPENHPFRLALDRARGIVR